MNSYLNTRVKRAFSLIEVIVVLAIIAILVALLFPVFQTARARSHTAVCLSNLHQLGSATALYATDYSDLIPFAPSPCTKRQIMQGRKVYGDPFDSLIKIMPDVRTSLERYGAPSALFHCPSDRMDAALVAEGGHRDTWFEECGASYDYDDIHALDGQALSNYPASASNILFSDLSFFHGGSSGKDGMVNLLYADLHVKTTTWRQRTKDLESYP